MATETSPRQAEAQTYLHEHRVLELFDNLTSMLIFGRPEKPKLFLIDILESLQASKTANLDTYPSLFNQSNMKSIYGMLDPTGRGHISKKEFTNALETLGWILFMCLFLAVASRGDGISKDTMACRYRLLIRGYSQADAERVCEGAETIEVPSKSPPRKSNRIQFLRPNKEATNEVTFIYVETWGDEFKDYTVGALALAVTGWILKKFLQYYQKKRRQEGKDKPERLQSQARSIEEGQEGQEETENGKQPDNLNSIAEAFQTVASSLLAYSRNRDRRATGQVVNV